MLQRKAYNNMLEWKRGNGESALLIEGARRTGKSTLAESFAKNEYATHLLINFETASQAVRSIFEDYRENIDDFFKYLLAYYNTHLKERDALVIFDEVQRFPTARSFIKQLVADGRYDYIETGSLVSIKKNVENIIIPSEEDKLNLEPLDFEEFLWACDNKPLAELIRESFTTLNPLPEALHKKAERLWREYLLVGGMPQSINAYLNENSFEAADKAKRRILNLYREDIVKFGGDDASRAAAIFNAIPGQLSKHEKKFTLNATQKNARYRDLAGAFFWLEDARMVNLCRDVNDPAVGLDLSLEEESLKCYMGDTGLLATMTFGDRRKTSNELYRNILFEKLGINEGILTENVVAQQLTANGHRLRFYSRRDDKKPNETMEIDFLLIREYENAALKQRVSPLEVKSSTRFSTKSLTKFKTKFGKRIGTELVLSPRLLKREEERLYLPLYMMFCL